MATKTKKRKTNRPRMYDVFVKARRDGVIPIKAKSRAEAEKLAEERIEDAWDIDDAADWHEMDKCDVDIVSIAPKSRRRR